MQREGSLRPVWQVPSWVQRYSVAKRGSTTMETELVAGESRSVQVAEAFRRRQPPPSLLSLSPRGDDDIQQGWIVGESRLGEQIRSHVIMSTWLLVACGG